MHHVIKIKEHSKHNLDVRPHLSSLFRSWRARIGLHWDDLDLVSTLYPYVITFLSKSESTLTLFSDSSTIHSSRLLSKIYNFRANLRFMPKMFLKSVMAWANRYVNFSDFDSAIFHSHFCRIFHTFIDTRCARASFSRSSWPFWNRLHHALVISFARNRCYCLYFRTLVRYPASVV